LINITHKSYLITSKLRKRWHRTLGGLCYSGIHEVLTLKHGHVPKALKLN